MEQNQTINFFHVTPDGCNHSFNAPVYSRGLDTEPSHFVFMDGKATCSCHHKEHQVGNGYIEIQYEVTGRMSGETVVEHDSINLAKRNEALGVII